MQTIVHRHLTLYAMAVFSISTATFAHASDPASIDPSRFDARAVDSIDRWSGFYAGVNVDILAGLARAETGAGNPDFKNKHAKAFGGLHLGYNFAPSGDIDNGGWMFGLEADYSKGNIGENKTDPILGNVKTVGTFTSSVRARAGFAWESLYLYGTAGIAVSDYNLKAASDTSKEVRLGLAAGLGAEFALSDNWSMRGEVIGYNFGDRIYTFNGTQRKVDLKTMTFRIGLTRKF
ncbi:MAG: outer membrane beta-barrel protein [Rhizobiaceae bacterium]